MSPTFSPDICMSVIFLLNISTLLTLMVLMSRGVAELKIVGGTRTKNKKGTT